MFDVKQFDANAVGRDFVIGDLHGCHTLLMRGLKYLNFNPEVDRVFSVGDLADRGPESVQCLSLLTEPWFHAVMGNHENMLLSALGLALGPTGMVFMMNGGDWINELDENAIREFCVKHVVNLPGLMHVKMPNGKAFNVIHAEIFSPGNLCVTDEQLLADLTKFGARETFDGPTLIWGRTVFLDWHWGNSRGMDEHGLAKWKRNPCNDWENDRNTFNHDDFSVTFSGHTTVKKPCSFGKLVNLDTGAFHHKQRNWAGLTITEPLTGKFWKVSDDISEVELFKIV